MHQSPPPHQNPLPDHLKLHQITESIRSSSKEIPRISIDKADLRSYSSTCKNEEPTAITQDHQQGILHRPEMAVMEPEDAADGQAPYRSKEGRNSSLIAKQFDLEADQENRGSLTSAPMSREWTRSAGPEAKSPKERQLK